MFLKLIFLIIFIYFQESEKYEDIPRYDLSKDDIRTICREIFQHYPGTTYTKLIYEFYKKLFDAELCCRCSAVGTAKKKEGGEPRPGLCENKKRAIFKITGMAGFRQSYSQFNVALNNVLKTARNHFGVSQIYDGRYRSRIQRYHDDEEAKAVERERAYNASRNRRN